MFNNRIKLRSLFFIIKITDINKNIKQTKNITNFIKSNNLK